MKMKSQFKCSLEREFENENQMARAFVFTDYSVSPHQHEFYEINIILSGQGVHLIEENRFSVQKGDVFVIPPNIIHAYTDCHNMDVYNIVISPELIQNYAYEHRNVKGYNLLMEIEPFLRNHYDQNMFLHLSASELSVLKNELDLINDTNIAKLENCETLKNFSIIKNIYWMSLLLYQQMHGSKKENQKEKSIIHVLEFIHECYAQKITIDILCQYGCVSRPTLMRNFKEICGCAPMHYVMKYRKNLAEQLLKKTSMSKTQIAQECGFYDLSHMERYLSAE